YRHRSPYREARPHRRQRRGGCRARARAFQHPRLGGAARRGRCRGSRADDGRRPQQAAPARGRGDRRRHPRPGARQRAARRARLLRGAEGDRMTALTDLGIAAIRDGVRAGDFSAREVAEAFIAAVEKGRALNAFLVETPDHALAAAEAADAARASGELKPLSGVPLGIKDLFATKGVRTSAASRILEGFTPTYESTVTARLFAAGAGMLGKLNLDEFAMGSSNETSAFGAVTSPWRRNDGDSAPLAPGGSSGGSAAAVSARLCPGATGTDTGGSIR